MRVRGAVGFLFVLVVIAVFGRIGDVRAAQIDTDGSLDVSAWQAQADGSMLGLAGVTVILSGDDGGQIASVLTDANGNARLNLPEGLYTLTLYRNGEDAAARLTCGDVAWDYSGQINWGGYTAEQDAGLLVSAQHSLCRRYLFQDTPRPPQAPAPPALPVHITIDDGYVYLCQTVDLVIQLNIHATFFLTGQAILAYPDCVRRLVAAGNQLANHSYAHENLTRLSRDQILSTLQRTENAALAVVGVSTKPFCRPPYGAINAAVRQAAAAWGCQMILWDRDTRDWAGVPVAMIVNAGLSLRCTGDTVLMHTQAFANERYALPTIISTLRARGCEPVVY